MRWLAAIFLVTNVILLYLASASESPGRTPVVATGNLPRVVSLKTTSPATDTPGPGSVEPVCARIGWFDSRGRVAGLVENQPLAEEVHMAMVEVERELPPLHWVIIPPQPQEVARKQFRDIQRQGMDSYLVTQGENLNAISLGLFESREAAITVLEEKKRQNLNVVLANFPRNQISYALVFKAEPELATEMVQAVKADYGENFDFVEINPCEGVATPGQNP